MGAPRAARATRCSEALHNERAPRHATACSVLPLRMEVHPTIETDEVGVDLSAASEALWDGAEAAFQGGRPGGNIPENTRVVS